MPQREPGRLSRLAALFMLLTLAIAACGPTAAPAPTPASTAPGSPTAAGTTARSTASAIAGRTLPQPTLPTPSGSQVKLDSILVDVAQLYQRSGQGPAEARARETGLLNDANEVRLTLVLTDTNTGPVADRVTGLGGRVTNTAENMIELVVPFQTLLAQVNGTSLLQELANFTTVKEVRVTPLPQTNGADDTAASPARLRAGLAAVVSEGVEISGANAWHRAGLTGRGVKVGIVDVQFSGYEALQGQELPTNLTARSFTRDGKLGGGPHGTGCAEIVHAMAPDAELYLAQVDTDLASDKAIRWLVDEVQVQVLSISLGSGTIYRGDGSGFYNKAIDYARSKGVLPVVAAGNAADAHYAATFTDADGDGWHDFAPGENLLAFSTNAALRMDLRWEAWTGTPVNYDLYIYDSEQQEFIASSRNNQDGGREPTELIVLQLPQASASRYFVAVRAATPAAAERPVAFEITTPRGKIDRAVAAGSVATPGDARTALTVGATHWQTDRLETYSSQGQTIDGRIKPEIAGPTVVSTAAYNAQNPPRKFNGTSAATPHVAGAAALVWGAQPGATPDSVQAFLLGRAKPFGATIPNNQTGSGRLQLVTASGGVPPATASPTRARSTPTRVPTATTTRTATSGTPASGTIPPQSIVGNRLWEGQFILADNPCNLAAAQTLDLSFLLNEAQQTDNIISNGERVQIVAVSNGQQTPIAETTLRWPVLTFQYRADGGRLAAVEMRFTSPTDSEATLTFLSSPNSDGRLCQVRYRYP